MKEIPFLDDCVYKGFDFALDPADQPELTLDECIEILRTRVPHHSAIPKKALTEGANFYKTHWLAIASLNRSVGLVQGFCLLIRSNFICAAPLIRLQLDNLLRFNALSWVADKDAFTKRFISGERINTLKDKRGNKLTDRYLVEKMNGLFPGIAQIYEKTCSYVHLSEKHFFHSFKPAGDQEVFIPIAERVDEMVEERERTEAAYTMDRITVLLLSCITWYFCGDVKKRKHG